ncbi:uncharacterized protein UV8b_06012 [Ustilaginoidea virens]|uniref:Mannan endo-1,6-alpha-mannosidase n=1 Tax=Ustilaginoidea virens TaxID=1159556 RepID=A0A8E5HUD9_USTVR|nr:uncharacterized protein UV8b_06012 [Ustilaginoidea virens]QUC21769.1 hypothetical protein UV8b_06012 [Ustilaginoidea virens]
MFTSSLPRRLAIASCVLGCLAEAQLKLDNRDDIIQTAKTVAHDLMLLYHGNEYGQTPGLLPGPPASGLGPYYWWQAGALMGTLIDYWKFTGDSTYNDIVMQGMLHQVGEDQDYMPRNQTLSLGNDDQGFWGLSALLAAENKFPDPPADKPQWLALAQAVWNTQANPDRYDGTCNGGLRWQIPPTNQGYDYKNTISNGVFFNMGARLARYTQNDSYAVRAEKAWDWLWGVQFIDHQTWAVYDGANVKENCSNVVKPQYSYNAAILAQGAAFMYNYTNADTKWKTRLDNLLGPLLKTFFPNGIAYELPCEGKTGKGTCTPDMLSYKGYVHRWLAVVTQIAPYTKDNIMPILKSSAQAAVKQCTGGTSGHQCGFYWGLGRFVDPSVDRTTGAGEEMDVLAAVSSLLIEDVTAPVTNSTGGTSKGNPNAGGKDDVFLTPKSVTLADKVGAGIVTAVWLIAGGALFAWMSFFDKAGFDMPMQPSELQPNLR